MNNVKIILQSTPSARLLVYEFFAFSSSIRVSLTFEFACSFCSASSLPPEHRPRRRSMSRLPGGLAAPENLGGRHGNLAEVGDVLLLDHTVNAARLDDGDI